MKLITEECVEAVTVFGADDQMRYKLAEPQNADLLANLAQNENDAPII